MTEEKIAEEISVSIRIEFIHKPINKRIFHKKYPFIIQNEPFEYGIRVTNIGESYFSGALVDEFRILSKVANIYQTASKKLKIKPLNPGEAQELYLDKYTLWHEGALNLSCNLIPENDNEKLHTYQYHKDHGRDELHGVQNKWWNDYYCQGQQQLLQSTTNRLILFLTVIIVVESILGLKEVLQFISYLLATGFSVLASFFSMLES